MKSFYTNIESFYKISASEVFSYTLLSFCTFCEGACLIFVLHLLLLHRWLANNDLTTYDYILFLRQKDENPNSNLDIASVKFNRQSKTVVKINNEDKEKSDNVLQNELQIPRENFPKNTTEFNE